MTTKELKQHIRNGKYAWPGGYPIYFVTSDGQALSFDAVKKNYHEVLRAMKYPWGYSNWNVIDIEINFSNENLICAHSGEKIESAYGEENDND